MANGIKIAPSATLLIKLTVIIIVYLCISPTKYCALAEKSSNEKDSALTIVESASDEEANDAVVSDESTGVEFDSEEVGLDEELFKPSKEWKTVKEGQKIPAGLHVRMNLQTGKKEAKLMDDERAEKEVDDKNNNNNDNINNNRWDAGYNMGIINTEKQRFTRDELKNVVKNFKLKDMDSKQPKGDGDIRSKYRSYDELKKAMKDMEMAVKTEGEIITDLVKTLKLPTTNSEDMKTLLVDLEYYLHQIDNAILFCNVGGMERLLSLMNHTDDDVRAKAVHALGAAVQSNGKVQVVAMEHSILQQLLALLSVDTSAPVRKKSLFALSSLLRQFPFAQKKFLGSGGLSALAKLFHNFPEQSLKVKVVTLLTDLVLEHDLNTADQTPEDEVQKEKLRQYSEVNVREAMQADGWCPLLTSLLEALVEHDDVEKTLSAMSVLQAACQREFSSSLPKLRALASRYDRLAREEVEEEDPDSYFLSIHAAVEGLLEKIPIPFAREDL